MIPGALALATAGAVGAYTFGLGGRLLPATEVLVPVALALLAGGLVLRWPGTIPSAIVLLGASYLFARVDHSTVDGWAAGVGTALLGSAELAMWSIDHDRRVREQRSALAWRAAILAGLLVLAALLDVLVVGAAAVSAPAGLLLVAIGVAASVAAVALVLRLLRS